MKGRNNIKGMCSARKVIFNYLNRLLLLLPLRLKLGIFYNLTCDFDLWHWICHIFCHIRRQIISNECVLPLNSLFNHNYFYCWWFQFKWGIFQYFDPWLWKYQNKKLAIYFWIPPPPKLGRTHYVSKNQHGLPLDLRKLIDYNPDVSRSATSGWDHYLLLGIKLEHHHYRVLARI